MRSIVVTAALIASLLGSRPGLCTEAPAPTEAPSPGVVAGSPKAGNPEADRDARFDEQWQPMVLSRTPGTDTNLCLSWEVSMTSDPNRQGRVSIVQGSTLGVSTDGGDNFTFVNVGTFLPPTHVSFGDGTAAYDKTGRLFVAILGNPVVGGGWDVFVSQHDPTTAALVSGPVNVTTAAAGFVTGMNADKPWLAADADPFGLSTLDNRLYVVFAITTGAVTGDFEMWGAWSSDQGQTWTLSLRNGAGQPISDATDGRAWPPHVAVAANGDVYATYHAQGSYLNAGGNPDGISGRVVALRSSDGGASFNQRSEPFPVGAADTTWNAQSQTGAIADAAFWTIGTGQGWILPDPANACTVHVVTSDDPDNDPTTGDAADVVMATSTDCGVSWAAPQKIDDGAPGTWQLLPTAAIDPVTGAIAVTWLDNRNAGVYPLGARGNSRVDLRLRYSNSGGVSWLPSLIVNDLPVDPDATSSTIGTAIPSTFRIGEYNGVTFSECTAHMAWAGQPTCGGAMDTYYDRDPEISDLTEPDITCPDDVQLSCVDSTHPSATGWATVSDVCDADPELIYFDQELGGNCPPGVTLNEIDRTWHSDDAAGNSNNCVQHISIFDFDAPDITVPAPIMVECNSPGGVPASDPQIQSWLDLASAVDACSEAELSTFGVPSLFPVSCEATPTFVSFVAGDECGNGDSEASTVTVVDTTPPTLLPPAPETLECTAPGGTPVDDPSVLAWAMTAVSGDVCSTPTLSVTGPKLLPAGCFPGTTSLVTVAATDLCTNRAQVDGRVTVVDELPPVVSVRVTAVELWPADHEYVCYDDFLAGISISDVCASLPVAVGVTCQSSQCDDAPCDGQPLDDDGATLDDCSYDDGLDRLCVRAERADFDLAGRLYTVSVEAADSCGNAGTTVVREIHVPHSCGGNECLLIDGFESGDTSAWSVAVP